MAEISESDVMAITHAIKDLWREGSTPAEIDPKTFAVQQRKHEDPQVFAESVITAAGSTGVRFLEGFLGGKPGETRVRLYTSLEFTEYFEIPVGAIVRIIDLRSPFNPLAGQAMWVQEGVELTRVQEGVSRETLQSKFVDGEIGGGGGDDQRGYRVTYGCGRYTQNCGRYTYGCGRYTQNCGRYTPGC
jgi:hypothetical protein